MPSSRTARSSLRKSAPRCGIPQYTPAHRKCTISGMPPRDDDGTLPATPSSAAPDDGSGGGESLLAALAREISGPTPLQEAFARYRADKLLGAGGNGIV